MKKEYKIDDLTPFLKSIRIETKTNVKQQTGQSINQEMLSQLCSSFYGIIDIPKMKFNYISPTVKNVLGYSESEMLKYGLQLIFELYHPENQLTQKSIHSNVKDFFSNISTNSKTKYVFSFDVQLKSKSGKYIKLLQHNRYLSFDKSGIPLQILVICHDISDFKAESYQVLTISKINKNGLKKISRAEFYPEYENGILTKKETEIWKMINNGCSSKDVGQKLNISIHTVNTHRKKIYKKLRARS
jgi:hypothetical protein